MASLFVILQTPASQSGEAAGAVKPSKRVEAPNIVSGVMVYGPSNRIDGLEVIDRKRCKQPAYSAASVDPHVVSTYPDYGSLVPAGPLLLRATFDQPMSPCSFSIWIEHDRNVEFVGTPALMSADHRTFMFVVKLAPGADFEFSFNALSDLERSYRGFRSQSGGYGVPHVLVFRSSVKHTSASVLEAARRDPAFSEINQMPGKLISIGVPLADGPPLMSKH